MGRGATPTPTSTADPRRSAAINSCVLAKVSRETGGCEDATLEVPEQALAMVVDGMGGPGHGDLAAAAAVRSVAEDATNMPVLDDVVGRYRWLQQAVERASDAVADVGKEVGNREAGATAVLAVLARDEENGSLALLASVGDSRAYRFNSDKQSLERLTDDSRIVRNPDIEKQLDEATEYAQLSPEALRRFKGRNVVSDALGFYKDRRRGPNIESVPLEPEDILVLTSDGVHDNLTTGEIAEVCSAASTGDELAEGLCQRARSRSLDEEHLRAKDDDISVIVLSPAQPNSDPHHA